MGYVSQMSRKLIQWKLQAKHKRKAKKDTRCIAQNILKNNGENLEFSLSGTTAVVKRKWRK